MKNFLHFYDCVLMNYDIDYPNYYQQYNLTKEFKNLIEHLLCYDPSERYSIDEIYSQITQSDVVIEKFREELENRKNYHDVNIYDFNNSIWVNLDKLIYTFNDLIIK